MSVGSARGGLARPAARRGFELFLDSASSAVVVLDPRTKRVLAANLRFEELCGPQAGPPFSAHLLAAPGIHPDVPIARADGTVTTLTVRVVHAAGEHGGQVAVCFLDDEPVRSEPVLGAPLAARRPPSIPPPGDDRSALHHERIAAIGAFADSISHELRSAIGVLVGSREAVVSHLQRYVEMDEELQAVLDDEEAAIRSLDRVLGVLMGAASTPSASRAVAWNEVVHTANEVVRDDLAQHRLTLQVEGQADAVVRADFGDSCHIMVQLLQCVMQTAEPCSTVELDIRRSGSDVLTSVHELMSGDGAVTGINVKQPIVGSDRKFLAGLVLARQIARRHDGDLLWSSRAGMRGARYELRLRAA